MNAPTKPPMDTESLRHVRKPVPHDSGFKHVQGSAQYIDDIREPEGTLHVAVGHGAAGPAVGQGRVVGGRRLGGGGVHTRRSGAREDFTARARGQSSK